VPEPLRSSKGELSPSEWKRKAVHAGMGLFALSLRWLSWPAAALGALAALLFNLYAMPRIGRGIYRDGSRRRDTGIVAYAASVLALILLFRRDLPVAAALWAMMAFGDPAATIAGRTLGGPVLPWNGGKTWTGLSANWAVAGGFAVLFFVLTGGSLVPAAGLALYLGAGVYAFCESLRSGLDDNAVAALPTALSVVALASLVTGASGVRSAVLFEAAPLALAANAAVAVAAAALSLVSRSGAVAGFVVGSVIWIFGGWRSYVLLWIFFGVGTIATRLGYGRKAEKGVAQADFGRRGAAHVFANCGVPAALALLHAPPIALAAAFAAAVADTLGTEIGGLYGRRAFSPLDLTSRPAGAPGAVSVPGTLAGLGGAALVGSAAVLLHLVPASRLWVVAVAGLFGSLAESALSDLGSRRAFRLDHEFANAFNTFAGAAAALEIAACLDARALYLPFGGA
jgi:uncharacterized protein (TIGR00297 family)